MADEVAELAEEEEGEAGLDLLFVVAGFGWGFVGDEVGWKHVRMQKHACRGP